MSTGSEQCAARRAAGTGGEGITQRQPQMGRAGVPALTRPSIFLGLLRASVSPFILREVAALRHWVSISGKACQASLTTQTDPYSLQGQQAGRGSRELQSHSEMGRKHPF